MPEKSAFQETYVRAAGAVAFIAIIDAKGDEGIGSAFHISDGIFVSARHVIDGVTIKEMPQLIPFPELNESKHLR
jgi:hypothetical protein